LHQEWGLCHQQKATILQLWWRRVLAELYRWWAILQLELLLNPFLEEEYRLPKLLRLRICWHRRSSRTKLRYFRWFSLQIEV
jgi:hypothetical protein